MALMLTTELQGRDLYSSTDVVLSSTELKGMPTVQLMRVYGGRSALKAVVGHATRCLVRHSRWILSNGGAERGERGTYDASCVDCARGCNESLGSAVCVVAWLFCVDEGIDIAAEDATACSFVIRDEFLATTERSLYELQVASGSARDKLTKRLKLYFLMALREEFAEPLVAALAKLIDVEWH